METCQESLHRDGWSLYILSAIAGFMLQIILNHIIARIECVSRNLKVQQILTSFTGRKKEDCKLVLCVRTDIGMGKGKIAAQCSHATLGAYKNAMISKSRKSQKNIEHNESYIDQWEYSGQKKVALKINSLEELNEIHKMAQKKRLNSYVVEDAGLTQIDPGTYTVVAVGPGPESIINEVTGHLRLL